MRSPQECVADFDNRDEAIVSRDLLRQHGIASTMSESDPPGRMLVWVAVEDLDRAIELLEDVVVDEEGIEDVPFDDEEVRHFRSTPALQRSELPPLPTPRTNSDWSGFLPIESAQLLDYVRLQLFIGRLPPAQQRDAWCDACRCWLVHLAKELGPDYAVVESEHFQVLGLLDPPGVLAVLRDCELFRKDLAELFADVVQLQQPGKLVVMVIAPTTYETVISQYHPEEGDFIRSGGMCIRDPHLYPHVICQNRNDGTLSMVIAHELTHLVASHLQMPLWLEEGMTQFMEYRAAPGIHELHREEMHNLRWFWQRNSLGLFWSGYGFQEVGGTSHSCYLLARLLFQVLVADMQSPLLSRWFFGNKRRDQLLKFLKEARDEDAGEAAALKYLGYPLEVLAEKVLGPGDWTPRPA